MVSDISASFSYE